MSDSSDDDVGLTGMERLCEIDVDDSIKSVSSRNYPVKFYKDSFIIKYEKNTLIIYLNPMFAWRLIFANKLFADNENEFVFHKLRLLVMRLGTEIYLTNKTIEYKLDDVVTTKPSTRIFDMVYANYGRLYMTIRRGCDQTEPVKQFLTSCVVLLRYLSYT
jgi:hypothetical protein